MYISFPRDCLLCCLRWRKFFFSFTFLHGHSSHSDEGCCPSKLLCIAVELLFQSWRWRIRICCPLPFSSWDDTETTMFNCSYRLLYKLWCQYLSVCRYDVLYTHTHSHIIVSESMDNVKS